MSTRTEQLIALDSTYTTEKKSGKVEERTEKKLGKEEDGSSTAAAAAASHRDLSQQDSSVDDSWSILEDSDITTINYGLLGEPATPYLLDPLYGEELNKQLLTNNIVYPGKFDRAGYDIVFVFENALRDPTYSLSFTYVFDAILGYFYDLSEHVLDRDYVKDVLVVLVLNKKVQTTTSLHLMQFIKGYKDHNMKLLIVRLDLDSGEENKTFKQILSNVQTGAVFREVDWCTATALHARLDTDVIPTELDGDLDTQIMDSWLRKRLKFEVFWEDCRNSYSKLQYLPASLKEALKKVLLDQDDKCLETIKQKYRQDTEQYSFSFDQKNCQAHSQLLLEDLNEKNTNEERIMTDAIRSLTRIMSELDEHYRELQRVLEASLEAQWRWAEFKKDVTHLTTQAVELRDHIDNNQPENESYNTTYSAMQTVKTSFHELSKRKELLPIKKHNKAEKMLASLEQVIAEIFTELGKNNEKMVTTEFVVNIQFDILTWIKEFEDLLCINIEADVDFLKAMINKDSKIRTKLKYCPIEVMEEYFVTCEKIGTDFLLAAVLGVETCITNLIEKITETHQHINNMIRVRATAVTKRVASLLERVKDTEHTREGIVESLEKVISLLSTFIDAAPLEYPEILDITALRGFQAAPLVCNKEVFGEVVETTKKFVKVESEEVQISHIARSNSSRSKREQSYSSRSRTNSIKRARTLDDHLDQVEALVKILEHEHSFKKLEEIATAAAARTEKSGQKIFYILKEFKDTEEAYIRSLKYLTEDLILKAFSDDYFTLDSAVRDCLGTAHSILKEMLQLHRNFIAQVRTSNGGALKFAQVFTSLTANFSVYIAFIKHQTQLEHILSEDYFRQIQNLNSDALPADSYINKPLQRLCKYKLLFEDLLANTENVFERPAINQSVLLSRKLLRTINGMLHLEEETFTEPSQFYMYAKVILQDTSQAERKAYMFKEKLYLCKASREYACYEMQGISLLSVEKPMLQLVLGVSLATVQTGGHGTLKRSTSTGVSLSLKKMKGPANITLMFQEHSELMEWAFRFQNILGKYY